MAVRFWLGIRSAGIPANCSHGTQGPALPVQAAGTAARAPSHLAFASPIITGATLYGMTSSALVLRTHRSGDLGWIVSRHGKLYAEEYGYNEKFEGVVAEVAAGFLSSHDSHRERCWIAELDGEMAGCIMLVKKTEDVAKLRVLLVEPKARGRGVGAALIQECVQFARTAGYRKITLWTHNILTAARHLYERAGFRLVHSEPAAEGFGRELVDETWELDL